MPKPWKDKDTIPYQRQTDPDGGAVGAEPYAIKPGEGQHRAPESTSDSEGAGDTD